MSGIGFLYGLELVEDKKTKEPASETLMNQVLAKCREKGLIISRNGDTVPGFNNVLIIAPPLSSTEEDLQFVVQTVRSVLTELCR